MGTINVEKIMEEIREDIKSKGYTNDMLSFDDVQAPSVIKEEYDQDQLVSALHNMSVYAYVPWYRDLSKSRIKRFIQKLIRKFVAFLIAPVTDQQSDFNKETLRGVGQLAGYIEQSENQLEDLAKAIELLEAKIVKLEAEIKTLKEKNN